MSRTVRRSKLELGKEYYFNLLRDSKGIFAGRSKGLIFFTPTEKGMYETMSALFDVHDPQYCEEFKDCIVFTDDNDLGGFQEVIESTDSYIDRHVVMAMVETAKDKLLYDEDEMYRLTLDAVNLGMRIRQDQLSGYNTEKSGKELHQEWFDENKKQ